jgi:hypothetical protein
MPAANVRRWGMGSPERNANRQGTQVENLCYVGTHRLKTSTVRLEVE